LRVSLYTKQFGVLRYFVGRGVRRSKADRLTVVGCLCLTKRRGGIASRGDNGKEVRTLNAGSSNSIGGKQGGVFLTRRDWEIKRMSSKEKGSRKET